MKIFKEPFEAAGLGLGLGIVGDAFNSEGLKQGGQTATNFVGPTVNISMGGAVVKQLRGLGKLSK